jgi:hypothetical protein
MPNQDDRQFENPNMTPGGVASDAFWGYMKFAYPWSAAEMLKSGPRKGYFLPWTGPGSKLGNIAKQHGVNTVFSGDKNTMRAMRRYRPAAWGGLKHKSAFKQTVKALTPRLGAAAARRAATGAAASVMLGTAAGVGLALATAGITFSLAKDITIGGYQMASRAVSQYRGLELGGYFPETQAAATSRQRNLQAITSSNLQARSAIGNEAMLFHR